MLLIRPIAEQDYPALHQIAQESGYGFTSLPVDAALLQGKIARSVASFNKTVSKPTDESYLMVLEDQKSDQIVGICGIEAAVGADNAFYHYRLGMDVHVSEKLGIRREVQTLTLCNDYTGASELCTLFVRPAWRRDQIGRYLSRSRFLLLAAFAERFSQTVIAEMRGVCDRQGNSPFWQWLQQHFFGIDFPTADYLTGVGDKVFVAELMPRNPIYVNLLSPEAQAVVGQVHEKTQPARRLLEQDGFRCRGYVDIFDAGPTLECQRDQILGVQQSMALIAQIDQLDGKRTQNAIISNGRMPEYRALRSKVVIEPESGKVWLDPNSSRLLQVLSNETVWLLPL